MEVSHHHVTLCNFGNERIPAPEVHNHQKRMRRRCLLDICSLYTFRVLVSDSTCGEASILYDCKNEVLRFCLMNHLNSKTNQPYYQSSFTIQVEKDFLNPTSNSATASRQWCTHPSVTSARARSTAESQLVHLSIRACDDGITYLRGEGGVQFRLVCGQSDYNHLEFEQSKGEIQ